ncbi:Rieske 2Fe-2S domain-containing protein [Aeromicrobium sp. CF4.19]|uniref:cytochrome bc1 complex Rieske iron-sulfur subunit n=1 Tax=Aeromicrobium sp. CF4.19 TaxID=3373082 RepID=UPI003EE7F1E4
MSDDLEPTSSHETEPVRDPGLPEHQWRPTDVDPAQERRTERQISAMFLAAPVLFIGFVVAYFTVDFNQTFLGFSALNFALGMTLGGGLLLIGVGIIQWAKKLMSDHEMVEMRHPAGSSDEDRAAVMTDINAGLKESTIARRPMIRNSLLLSMGVLAVPSVVLLRDLGPRPFGHTETVWETGMRVVNDVSGLPMRPADIEVGQLVNAEPAAFFPQDGEEEAQVHGHDLLAAKGKAAVIVVRMRPEDITAESGKENWGIDGILCFSKICTHVGCPISLWEQQTHHLLCPCHQSTFDLADNGKVIFGPAKRPVPQLPLGLDDEGYLIAMSDFPDIVAPSYPELARDQKKLDEQNRDGES